MFLLEIIKQETPSGAIYIADITDAEGDLLCSAIGDNAEEAREEAVSGAKAILQSEVIHKEYIDL